MRKLIARTTLVATLAASLSAGLLAGAPARAQGSGAAPTLRTAKIGAGLHIITAEIAADDATRMRGLMFRTSLAPNHGMFFVFEGKGIHCMWMRNTFVPLSVAFVDDDGTIVNIEDMQPKTEDSHCAQRPVRYALEMERGWFAKRGIKPGFRLTNVPPK